MGIPFISSNRIDTSSAANQVRQSQQKVDENTSIFDSAKTEADNASQNCDTFQSSYTEAQSAVSNAQSEVSTAQNAVSTAQGNVSTAQSAVSTAQSNVSAAQTALEDAYSVPIETTVNEDGTTTVDPSKRIEAISQAAAKLAQEIAKLEEAKAQLETANNELNEAIQQEEAANTALNEAISAEQTASNELSEAQTTAALAQSQLENASANLETAKIELQAAQNELSAVEAEAQKAEEEEKIKETERIEEEQAAEEAEEEKETKEEKEPEESEQSNNNDENAIKDETITVVSAEDKLDLKENAEIILNFDPEHASEEEREKYNAAVAEVSSLSDKSYDVSNPEVASYSGLVNALMDEKIEPDATVENDGPIAMSTTSESEKYLDEVSDSIDQDMAETSEAAQVIVNFSQLDMPQDSDDYCEEERTILDRLPSFLEPSVILESDGPNGDFRSTDHDDKFEESLAEAEAEMRAKGLNPDDSEVIRYARMAIEYKNSSEYIMQAAETMPTDPDAKVSSLYNGSYFDLVSNLNVIVTEGTDEKFRFNEDGSGLDPNNPIIATVLELNDFDYERNIANGVAPEVARAIHWATTQVGLAEDTEKSHENIDPNEYEVPEGDNKGYISQYCEAVGADNIAWCAAFVANAFGYAAEFDPENSGYNPMYPAEIGAENINLLFPNNSPSTADLVTVRYIQQAAVDSGYFKSMDSIENGEEQINPGDVLIIRYPGKNTGHTGLVVQCDEDYIYTVEGNANQAVRLKKYPRSILRDYNFAGFIDMNRLYSGGNDYVIPECSIPEYLFVDVTSGESRTR